MNGFVDPLDKIFDGYIKNICEDSIAIKTFFRALSLVGIGARPVLDHIIFRTSSPRQIIAPFLEFGYGRDLNARILPDSSSWEIYRCENAPAILLSIPHTKEELDWLNRWEDDHPYVIAVRVKDIDQAVFNLEKQGVIFLRPSTGSAKENLREIAIAPSTVEGMDKSFLLLVERHQQSRDFYAPNFWRRFNV